MPSRRLPLNPEALAAATAYFSQFPITSPNRDEHLADAIREYLHTARFTSVSVRTRSVSPESTLLAKMGVGEIIHCAPQTRQSVYKKMNTARRLADNKGLRWHTELLTSGEFRVTRRADFSSDERIDRLSPHTTAAVQLQPGQSVVIPDCKTTSDFNYACFPKARKILAEPLAKWKVQTLNRGVRLTRIR